MLLVQSFQLVPKTHPEQTGFLYMQSETEKSLSVESMFSYICSLFLSFPEQI